MRHWALAIANYPEVIDEIIDDFENALMDGQPSGKPKERARLADWFLIKNGNSPLGYKNYALGSVPYVSSGESYTGIAAFIEPHANECYSTPCVTVSAFGHAYIQPWSFCARGNGGSAVRVHRPKFALSVPELLWFVGQINAQRWRFHYGRMAIPQRLGQLHVDPPPTHLPQISPLKNKLLNFRDELNNANRINFLIHTSGKNSRL